LFKKLQESSFTFVARCKKGFAKIVDEAPMGDSVVTLKNGISVRIVKFELDSRDIENLYSINSIYYPINKANE